MIILQNYVNHVKLFLKEMESHVLRHVDCVLFLLKHFKNVSIIVFIIRTHEILISWCIFNMSTQAFEDEKNYCVTYQYLFLQPSNAIE